jgi:hypothetical protein
MKDKYSVAQALAQWFDKQLTAMPDEPRRVAEAYIPKWSELSDVQRTDRALEIDRQRNIKAQIKLASANRGNERRKSDPAAIKEDSLLFADFSAIDDIEREIREIELMPASIPSEQEAKNRLLADARQRLVAQQSAQQSGQTIKDAIEQASDCGASGHERDARIHRRLGELRASGKRAFLKAVAEEEGVSESAIKQARDRHKKRVETRPAASIIGQLAAANK